jgi:hypothetical protein
VRLDTALLNTGLLGFLLALGAIALIEVALRLARSGKRTPDVQVRDSNCPDRELDEGPWPVVGSR